MIKKVRPLTELELQQLRITQVALKKNLKEPYRISFYPFILIIGFFLLFLILSKMEVIAIIITITVIIILMIFSYFKVKNRTKKKLKIEIEKVGKLLEKNKIQIIEYHCNRAINFRLNDYEEVLFLEVSQNELLCIEGARWGDIKLLPNTHFELYTNEDVAAIFDNKVYVLGSSFNPIHFPEEVYSIIEKFLEKFQDGEIINQSFDNFLHEIERQVKA